MFNKMEVIFLVKYFFKVRKYKFSITICLAATWLPIDNFFFNLMIVFFFFSAFLTQVVEYADCTPTDR